MAKGDLFILSPEDPNQCKPWVEPNTCYPVTDFYQSSIEDFRSVWWTHPDDSKAGCSCEILTDEQPGHLHNGGRWLLLEQL